MTVIYRRLARLIAVTALLPIAAIAQEAATPVAKPAADAAPTEAAAPATRVAITTNMGRMIVELDAAKAPGSVANFLQYVDSGFYDGTVFHRVINNFMIQGGGFTADLQRKPTKAPIPNEANNGLSNLRGTIAMARTSDPNSATSQFFINTVDNPRLDFVSEQNAYTWGYAVFGKVVEGMDVVDAIRAVETGAQGPFQKDVPKQAVIIEHIQRVAADAVPASGAESAAAETAGD
ncbi:MAG: peptidyl-prolyl cis-trans isomerase [Xanthomonadales bacterium]|nr:peptidyl-prolyl cis-trans isomerase [Xanthomonadales bacterium]